MLVSISVERSACVLNLKFVSCWIASGVNFKSRKRTRKQGLARVLIDPEVRMPALANSGIAAPHLGILANTGFTVSRHDGWRDGEQRF
jgi:hypothetical protein